MLPYFSPFAPPPVDPPAFLEHAPAVAFFPSGRRFDLTQLQVGGGSVGESAVPLISVDIPHEGAETAALRIPQTAMP